MGGRGGGSHGESDQVKGHEYVREAIRTYLEDTVPARLAAHLTANGLTSPDASALTFLLADGLQGVDSFPAVVVRWASVSDDQRTGEYTWLFSYELEVIVACDHRTYNDPEGASKDRDRLLLAVRECLYRALTLTNDIEILPRKRPEQTGAASETRAGLPLAAGTLSFVARVTETLTDLDPASEIVSAVDLDVAGVAASEDL
jgi:hypothetical protein